MTEKNTEKLNDFFSGAPERGSIPSLTFPSNTHAPVCPLVAVRERESVLCTHTAAAVARRAAVCRGRCATLRCVCALRRVSCASPRRRRLPFPTQRGSHNAGGARRRRRHSKKSGDRDEKPCRWRGRAKPKCAPKMPRAADGGGCCVARHCVVCGSARERETESEGQGVRAALRQNRRWPAGRVFGQGPRRWWQKSLVQSCLLWWWSGAVSGGKKKKKK